MGNLVELNHGKGIQTRYGHLSKILVGPNSRVRRGQLRVGLVGNKLKPWTNASQQALELLGEWPYPLVGQIRDSQAYVVMTALGKSLFDYHSQQIREHQADWGPLLKWLKK